MEKLIKKIKKIKFKMNIDKSTIYFKGNDCRIHYYNNEYYIILEKKDKIYRSKDFKLFNLFTRFLKEEKYFIIFISLFKHTHVYGFKKIIGAYISSPFSFILRNTYHYFTPNSRFITLKNKWETLYYNIEKEIVEHNKKIKWK
jgi:hypothetical protein